MNKFAAGVLLVAVVKMAGAASADVHSVASAVDEHYNHLHSLQAEFTEVYRGSGM